MNINQQEIIECARIEDFPSNAQEFINAIGIDNYLKLAFNFGGKKLYIPTREKTLIPIRNKIIREKHKILMENGDSCNKACKELAEEYGITDKQIYNIVSGRMR